MMVRCQAQNTSWGWLAATTTFQLNVCKSEWMTVLAKIAECLVTILRSIPKINWCTLNDYFLKVLNPVQWFILMEFNLDHGSMAGAPAGVARGGHGPPWEYAASVYYK